MKQFQPVVKISGIIHLHSAIFDTVKEAKEYIKKNGAYVWVGVKEVNYETYSELLEKTVDSAQVGEK